MLFNGENTNYYYLLRINLTEEMEIQLKSEFSFRKMYVGVYALLKRLNFLLNFPRGGYYSMT